MNKNQLKWEPTSTSSCKAKGLGGFIYHVTKNQAIIEHGDAHWKDENTTLENSQFVCQSHHNAISAAIEESYSKGCNDAINIIK